MSLRDYVREHWETDVKPTLKAMGRQGASELAQALKAFPESIGPVETTGTIGNPTQQQISQDMGLYGNRDAAKEQPSIEASVPDNAPEPDHHPELER